MRNLIIATTTTVLLLTGTSAFAATNKQNGCDIKKQKIETQIDYAKKHGNTHRIAGLQRALDNVNTYCTPESLYRDSQKNVAQKQEKVQEREAELLEEKETGDNAKIAKRERKLEEAKAELKEAQAELELYSK
ncbi:DUF1090 domain-containing protein [Providencia stuartii]|uniref:DUF1090 domain-containing protein n=2 Tax=Providencia TaxID=586 RepID=A0A1S1HND0_PROST|nr:MULTISPECIES: DUF1090 domain-containing protein [Providencia]MDV5227375.1 DUF1090 domain-containing protein [Providencia rettgeri]ELR5038871.1 DUF1090 domain-containing protein [Providencia stuartii]ELR5083023.1 DUF1090 domain-containing protein [Providencia stuartii]ELR5113910.1 DUF1090 domain-containing protein [Providencia stuartii]ELR5299890.1 DUF1090 domain-containing protein [Providencia stuartii]